MKPHHTLSSFPLLLHDFEIFAIPNLHLHFESDEYSADAKFVYLIWILWKFTETYRSPAELSVSQSCLTHVIWLPAQCCLD